MKIKKGDKIFVLSGKDKKKTGKVIKVFPEEGKIVVEGINIKKKHAPKKKEGQKGQIIQRASPFNVSSVKLVCSACGKSTRIGCRILENGKKVRICKKCNSEI